MGWFDDVVDFVEDTASDVADTASDVVETVVETVTEVVENVEQATTDPVGWFGGVVEGVSGSAERGLVASRPPNSSAAPTTPSRAIIAAPTSTGREVSRRGGGVAGATRARR